VRCLNEGKADKAPRLTQEIARTLLENHPRPQDSHSDGDYDIVRAHMSYDNKEETRLRCVLNHTAWTKQNHGRKDVSREQDAIPRLLIVTDYFSGTSIATRCSHSRSSRTGPDQAKDGWDLRRGSCCR
jgi:hypothetical protein